MLGSETDEVIEELFESLFQKCQELLGKKMRGSEFVSDSADFSCYKLHNISLNRSGSFP